MVLSGLKVPATVGTIPTPAALNFAISPAQAAWGIPANVTNAGLSASALSMAEMNVPMSVSLNGIDLKVQPNVAAACSLPVAVIEHEGLSHVRFTTIFPLGAGAGSGVAPTGPVGIFRADFNATFAFAASFAGVELLFAVAAALVPTPRAATTASATEILPNLGFIVSPSVGDAGYPTSW